MSNRRRLKNRKPEPVPGCCCVPDTQDEDGGWTAHRCMMRALDFGHCEKRCPLCEDEK